MGPTGLVRVRGLFQLWEEGVGESQVLNHQEVNVGGAKGQVVPSISKGVDAFKMSRTCPVAPTEPLLT